MVDVTKKIKLKKKLSKIEDEEKRREAAEEIGQYLIDNILDKVGSGVSPVTGKPFQKLTPAYKKQKAKISGSSKANLELFGDMLDALEYTYDDVKGEIEVGIFDSSGQADKAYGHNSGFKGHPNKEMRGTKYQRKFIANTKEKFNGTDETINDILEEYASKMEKEI